MRQISIVLLLFIQIAHAQKINRQKVVERHIVRLNAFDTLAALSVGNGRFAFTVDATGLQTFPEYYQHGTPLGTQSDWGWHSFPNKGNYSIEESLKNMPSHGRTVPYAVQISENGRKKEAANFMRQNPHRLQLGNLGFELIHTNGQFAQIADIQSVSQTLNPYTGEIRSTFVFEKQLVEVKTLCNQNYDIVSIQIKSNLLINKQLKVKLMLPFPTDQFTDFGTNYGNENKHSSKIMNANTIQHQLDSTIYYVHFKADKAIKIQEKSAHYFVIETAQPMIKLNVHFTKNTNVSTKIDYSDTSLSKFWQSGGAIDFAGSSDPRASELERRVILSQYLTKIQCSGDSPPQETGLTYNSWYGKPHMEMHWWHGVHFALWGRPHLLEPSLSWYNRALPTAKKIAKRQGFAGVRWPKMTDNDGGETASSVGSYLIWEQPHIITFAELIYQQKRNKTTLEKYKNLVFETADFMADFAYYDKETNRYILGKGIIPAQECFKPDITFNPTYELNYWHWALTTAQNWRKRLGLAPNIKYQDVIDKLSALPIKDGLYLATESTPQSYTDPNFMIDHPAVVGALGMLPETSKIDKKIMQNTYDFIWKNWNWGHTWGWDFPLMAMTATRLRQPEQAIDALMLNVRTNTYLPNGHNYQDKRLTLYLPGNGGLLAAVAMMATQNAFPKNGWKIRWEGLQKGF